MRRTLKTFVLQAGKPTPPPPMPGADAAGQAEADQVVAARHRGAGDLGPLDIPIAQLRERPPLLLLAALDGGGVGGLDGLGRLRGGDQRPQLHALLGRDAADSGSRR